MEQPYGWLITRTRIKFGRVVEKVTTNGVTRLHPSLWLACVLNNGKEMEATVLDNALPLTEMQYNTLDKSLQKLRKRLTDE